jgi:hypothetical protein
MGANAQTSVPTFTAGEVLTAANMNISARTGIPVFATTVTRDAAFGGTGEKTLAEGQFAYLEDSNTTQYYDGSTWQSVGVSPGLVYIGGASFTTVSTYSLPNDSFSATYSNYLLFVNLTGSSAGALNFRYRAAGSDYTGATYNHGGFNVTTGGTIQNDSLSGASQTSNKAGYIGNGSTDSPVVILNILRPYESYETRYNSSISSVNAGATLVAFNQMGGVVYQTTAYDSLTLIPASGTISGAYRLYGYRNS